LIGEFGVADPAYLLMLVQRIRAVAEDCFDHRASKQLHELASKIEHDINLGMVVSTPGEERLK
jgi:hypothetical protein